MKKATWKVHTIANCSDCDWNTSNYKNGQAIAAIHAKAHHHRVTGQVRTPWGELDALDLVH